MPEAIDTMVVVDEDERRLAELGYKQELNRTWSGFSNFAISFSIISILAGCFTSFQVAWNNGGPAAIAWGWPVVSIFILVIGMCLAELVSAYPTSGGIYWWASKLGGAKAGYYTGWLNLIGLLAIVASVSYGCATFLDSTIGVFDLHYHSGHLARIFLYFLGILVVAALVNIFSSHLLAIINNISVWWHVLGVAAVVAILIALPHHHASVSAVFTHRVSAEGFFSGRTHGVGYVLYVLPLSVILTQYTITGYDASAHLSEETHRAGDTAAKGMWRSIFYSAIAGWILLLSFLFAVQDQRKVTAGGGGVVAIFAQALTHRWGGTVLVISTVGQFYCAVACMTSTTRMLYAFSRDGAVPGAKLWSHLNRNRVPVYGVLLTAVISILITLPALVKVDIGGIPSPVAFDAVISIGVLGLYLCFAIPIYYRWKAGDTFQPGGWSLGSKYRWMCIAAIVEIILTSIAGVLPTSTGGAPWYPGFRWKFVNYSVLVVPGALLLLWIYWHASVKKWFRGPRTTIGTAAADYDPAAATVASTWNGEPAAADVLTAAMPTYHGQQYSSPQQYSYPQQQAGPYQGAVPQYSAPPEGTAPAPYGGSPPTATAPHPGYEQAHPGYEQAQPGYYQDPEGYAGQQGHPVQQGSPGQLDYPAHQGYPGQRGQPPYQHSQYPAYPEQYRPQPPGGQSESEPPPGSPPWH